MFSKIYNEVVDYLESNNGNDDDRGFTFRKRSEHMWRVFVWAKRLIEGCTENINEDALLTAALFHDAGRYISHSDHANQGALIFHDFAEKKQYDEKQAEFIEYLIRNHASKKFLSEPDTPIELVLLMEADMLDETGALGIVWDAMMSGLRSAQSYTQAYDLMLSHSCESSFLDANPMITEKGKEIWAYKQALNKEFIKQLKFDLGITE